MDTRRFTKGFTFIELLVVMLLISLLAGIGGLTYTTAQRSGRDSKRQADLRRLQGALELFYADEHTYPALTECSSDPSDPSGWVDVASLGGNLVSGGVKYTEDIPRDPDRNPAVSYLYCAFDSYRCYCLSAKMEKAENTAVEGECGATHVSGHTNGHYLTCP